MNWAYGASAVILVILVGGHATPAYAYIDPGAGSAAVQALVAGVLGAVFAIKVFWRRVLSRFRKQSDDWTQSK